MTDFAELDTARNVVQVLHLEGSETLPDDGTTYIPLSTPIAWSEQPTPTSVLNWPDGAASPVWVETSTLDEARAYKIIKMSAACAAAIFAGFTSSALGAEYLYPAKMTDQTNLAGSILDSLIPGPADWTTPFWCADSAGAWAFRMHTATQIQQVGRNGKTAILAAMSYNEALRAQIETATMAQLDTIVWAP